MFVVLKMKSLKSFIKRNTDLIEATSVSSDYAGFTASVFSKEEFPLVMKNEVQVKPGEETNFYFGHISTLNLE